LEAAGGDAALQEAAAAAAAAAAGPGANQRGLPAVQELIAAVKAAGMLCGVTIKPGTPVELLLPYIGQIDMVGGVGEECGRAGGPDGWMDGQAGGTVRMHSRE